MMVVKPSSEEKRGAECAVALSLSCGAKQGRRKRTANGMRCCADQARIGMGGCVWVSNGLPWFLEFLAASKCWRQRRGAIGPTGGNECGAVSRVEGMEGRREWTVPAGSGPGEKTPRRNRRWLWCLPLDDGHGRRHKSMQ